MGLQGLFPASYVQSTPHASEWPEMRPSPLPDGWNLPSRTTGSSQSAWDAQDGAGQSAAAAPFGPREPVKSEADDDHWWSDEDSVLGCTQVRLGFLKWWYHFCTNFCEYAGIVQGDPSLVLPRINLSVLRILVKRGTLITTFI